MTEQAEILALYRSMLRIRMVEETIAERYSEQEMRCPTHLCTGQEAVAAAAGLVLRKDDLAVSTHRAHGHYLGKGGDLRAMLAEIYGKATGCSKGKGGSMHLIDLSVGFIGSTPVVAGTIPVGVGLALSIQRKGTDQIGCIFFGDAATEEGVFYESVNFAVLRKLPVLMICENNLYSVNSPLGVRQPPGRSICEMTRGIGIRAAAGDGNDSLEVLAMIHEAADSVRGGGGPAFLEFATYRWREHCGPNVDVENGCRPEEEYLAWKARDPLARLKTHVLEHGLVTESDLSDISDEVRREIEDAFRFAIDSPFPDAQTAFQGVYQ